MEKMKTDIYSYLVAGSLANIFKLFIEQSSRLYQTHNFCPNRWIWLVAMATARLNLREKISSEAISGMNLKLCRNVHNISLYKKCAFIALLAMATSSFHWLVTKKQKNKWKLAFNAISLHYADIFVCVWWWWGGGGGGGSEKLIERSSTKYIFCPNPPSVLAITSYKNCLIAAAYVLWVL